MYPAALATLGLAACGARTDLGGRGAAPAIASACTDATDATAFKPIERYCSDGSNRARVAAPVKPHVVWSKDVPVAGSLLAGFDGTAFIGPGNGVSAFTLGGDDAWSAAATSYPGTSFLLPDRIETSDAFSGTRVRRSQTSGAMLGSSEWAQWGARVAVDEGGESFVELIQPNAFGIAFAGIARVTLDGKTQWIEKGDCDPGGSDFPAPHDFVRRDDHLLLVCNTHDSVEVLEVDANDVEVWKGFFDGSLSGNVVIAGDGALTFFVDFGGENDSLVTIMRDHGAELGGPTLARASIAAVARDGTLVVNTKDGVAAVSDGSLRWQQQVTSPRETFVDSDHTIITATNGTVVALDLASGSKIWEVALPTNDNVLSLASAGPGKIYALSETTLTLVSD